MREIPCIHDLEVRRKIVDSFKDYAQILSYPMPPLEVMTKGDGKLTEEYTKLVNDGFAEICAKYPDQFPGWVAQAALIAPDAGVREAERALKNGALGVQIYTNIAGKPLDDPAFEPFFAAMNKLNKPIWMHPARAANVPDYLSEKKSKYEIWWTFGWSYETAAAMARLVFSGIMDRYPNLKIITHHFGGIVPMLEGRIGPGWDQLGARTSDEDLSVILKKLKKRPLDYFKQTFYADTAVFSAACRRPTPDLHFTISTRSCSPPTARSTPKRAPCIPARLYASSRASTCRRPTRKRSGTAILRRLQA